MDLYPDITWTQFEQCCTGDPRLQFEEMCRRLFVAEYLDGKELPQSETSHPGVEIEPVLEPEREDGLPRKRISFQSKYFDNSVGYGQIKESAEKAVKHYKGKLDLIYLYSNLTLNPSRSSTYRETVDYLKDAGIELKPISDGAILDLLFKHENIARYYFLPRNRTFSSSGIVYTTMSLSITDEKAQTVTELPNVESAVYNRLLKEKIERCKELILDLNLNQLRAELDSLREVDSETVLFYRFLLEIHGNNMNAALEFKRRINNKYRHDAEWLYEFANSLRNIGYQEIVGLLPETHRIFFNELLSKQRLDNLVEIYEDTRNVEIDNDLRKTLTFYYSIALFNLYRVEEARKELEKLYGIYHVPTYKFFYLCADIQIKNMEYGFGTKDKAKQLVASLNELKTLSSQVKNFYQSNEKLVGMLELQAYYNLSSVDESYLEKANAIFNSLSESSKKDLHILYFLGMCHELAGKYEEALSLYSKPECKGDETIFYRATICMLRLGKYEELYEHLKDCTSDNPGVFGVKLAVEYRLGKEEYIANLNEAIKRYGTSLENLFPIAYHTEDTEAFNAVVKPILKEKIRTDLQGFNEGQKIALLMILTRHKQLPLILEVVKSGMDLRNIDGYIIHQLYEILINIANKANKKDKQNFTPSEELVLTEKIATAFINMEAYLDRFLHVRLGCYSAQERYFAMLQDSKRLYDLSGDLGVARNIVALLYSQNEKRAEEYEPYLSALSHSDIPAHAIAVCSGAMRLGHSEMAERYAYKALYLLNDEDDFEIYRNYFSYVSGFVLKRPEDKNNKHVSDNMVVELQDNFNEDNKRLVCLDSEAEFADEQNHSLGIEHLKQGDPNYTKLIRAGLGQVVKVFGSQYKVISFMPRAVYAFHFINEKIQEHPEKFDGVVFLVSTEDPQKMIEEIKKYTDQSEQTKHILACYHFEKTESGIPIDMLCYGDYSKYIDTFRMLLYADGQALYAGLAEQDEDLKGNFVPTLSTLVLLSLLGQMDLLDALRDKIGVIIPESYISFFEELFSESTRMMEVSPGTLATGEEGKLVMIENDKHIPEMWEEILEWCKKCNRVDVSFEERAAFSFAGEMTGDHLMASMKMNKIQLDALILAKKENAMYISDDLFMRKLASWAGIKNNNFTFFLYFLYDENYAAEITMSLSKTNYIYTPLSTVDRDNFREVIQNLLTGKRKEQLYGIMLERIRQSFLQAIGIAQT